ncbi:MAG: hypothetical protein IMZ52_03010 [Actinobacteria bacterium]|nr:hypothetical protein [Actinomycetota bacterium]MBE3114790.1 hypothetical protein [Actinomycetota bacterium]
MSYRPICDMWLLARPKIKFYGAYPNGFLERARVLIGCSYNDSILHVCGGKARDYPNKGFGPNDKTLDLDPNLHPDICMDVTKGDIPKPANYDWKGILIDPPYTLEDASHYYNGTINDRFPNPNELVKKCINSIGVGKKVGILHYICPSCPKNAKFIACIGIIMGFNNRIRCFSVYERRE